MRYFFYDKKQNVVIVCDDITGELEVLQRAVSVAEVPDQPVVAEVKRRKTKIKEKGNDKWKKLDAEDKEHRERTAAKKERDERNEKIETMIIEGNKTVAEIAGDVGVSEMTVYVVKKSMKARGLIKE